MVLIQTLLFTFISAWIDYENLKDNDYIESHLSRWCLRALFVLSIAMGDYKEIIGMTLVFTAIFDTSLNYMRGIDLFYLGDTALWDRIMKRIPYIYIVFKVVSLFVGVYLLLL